MPFLNRARWKGETFSENAARRDISSIRVPVTRVEKMHGQSWKNFFFYFTFYSYMKILAISTPNETEC